MKTVRGFVLGQFAMKQQDARLRVLTDEGVFTFFARSVLKHDSPNIAATAVGSYSSFSIEPGKPTGWTLKESTLIASPIDRFTEPLQLIAYEAMLELVAKAIPDVSPGLFELVFSAWESLKEPHPLASLARFYYRFLEHVGIGFTLEHCASCGGKTAIVDFQPEEGGLLCKRCSKKTASSSTLTWIQSMVAFFNKRGQTSSDQDLYRFLKMCDQHVEKQFDITLKSLGMIQTFIHL